MIDCDSEIMLCDHGVHGASDGGDRIVDVGKGDDDRIVDVDKGDGDRCVFEVLSFINIYIRVIRIMIM